MLARLATLGDTLTPERFCEVLACCGFADRTPRVDPDRKHLPPRTPEKTAAHLELATTALRRIVDGGALLAGTARVAQEALETIEKE